MVESWLLLMHDRSKYPEESKLPVCGRSGQPAARLVYGANPPPQLKDLLDTEWRASGAASKDDFALACVLRLDPDDLAARAPSFGRFRAEVSKWPTIGAR
jgi:hypothetical protein